MKQLINISFLLMVYVSMNSCGGGQKQDTDVDTKDTANAVHHENENIATLTNEQVKTIGIEFGLIEQKELTNSIKANGILTVPNQNKAFVTPLYSGVVKTLRVQPGSYIKQGEIIATIVNPNLLQLQQQLQQINTQIELATVEVNRQKQLVEGNAAPLKKLQQAEAELATLKTQQHGLEKQLDAIGASKDFSSAVAIHAPISGAVSKVSVQLGSNVDVSTPIAEIVNNSQLHLDLYVYEKDLPKLKANQTIHFTLTNNPGKEYDAEIYSIGTAFESDSKTIPVHARVMGNKAGLIDGMNITAIVSLDKSTVPAVPVDAIVSSQGQDYIFVVVDQKSNADNTTFEKVPVARGTTDVGYAEITPLKQIPSASKIVTKGSFFILAKMTNIEEDH